MGKLTDDANRMAGLAMQMNNPMIPATARAAIHESARIVAELAERVEQLEQKVAEHDQQAT